MRWRWDRRSGNQYSLTRAYDDDRLAGLAICKLYSEGRSIDLVDLFADDDRKVVTSSLTAIREYYGRVDIAAFEIWSMEHYPLHQTLLSCGFRKSGFSTGVFYKGVSSKCPEECEEITSYYLSMADSDVY
jgi:hypothetical protein